MSVFNFMETIFFISLGITFVLILLLVYHFKQRISAIEQKTDTMLEIINNIVKEIYVLKNAQQMTSRFFSTMSIHNDHMPVNVPNTEYISKKINVSDDESESDDDDQEETDEDDESDDDEEIEELNIEEIVSSTVENDDVVKVINVSLNEIELPVPVEEEETQEVESIEDLSPSPIQVEKVDSEEQENLEEDVQGESQKESSKEVYRKMTLQSLKTLVITKGLCSDPSKLKKTDLLKMLETEDE
jgi:hypothetical protein